jgi:hypothetical protein
MALLDIVTACWLQKRYLFGIDLTDDEGNEFPPELYQHAILSAIGEVSAEIGSYVGDRKEVLAERHDSMDHDGSHYYTVALDVRPVREVTRVALQYGDQVATELPKEWATLRGPTGGQTQLIPGQNAFSGVIFTPSGTWWATGAHRQYSPAWLVFDYIAGFDWDDPDERDELILRAIGLNAAALALDTAGDLIVGAGIANKSVSFDGVSTTLGTTSSATNAGYGARILSYRKQLSNVMKMLRARYRTFDFFAV